MRIKRRKPEPMRVNAAPQVRWRPHLQWVRGCECGIKGHRATTQGAHGPELGEPHVCTGKIEAAHVRTGTDGGTGKKPGDNWALPLCQFAHALQHRIGERAFEKRYSIDMKSVASKHWEDSPHRRNWEAKGNLPTPRLSDAELYGRYR